MFIAILLITAILLILFYYKNKSNMCQKSVQLVPEFWTEEYTEPWNLPSLKLCNNIDGRHCKNIN